MTSIGDTAQSMLLRRAVAQNRLALDRSSADLANGQASDPARHLGGHTARLSAIDASLSRNAAVASAIAIARTRLDAMQAALSNIDQLANRTAQTLLTVSQSVLSPGVAAVAEQSRTALDSMVAALNQRQGGQSLFAGTATDRPALSPVEDILAAARQATATAQSPAEMSALLGDWIQEPTGFPAAAGGGNSEPNLVPVGPGEVVTIGVSALHPDLRMTFQGLILGALLAEDRFAADQSGQGELARLASETLFSSAQPRSAAAADLGLAQSRLETSATRTGAESSTLQMARNDLLSVDSYDAASRLKDTEARLQLLYALTARLSTLSLAGFLR